MPGKTMKTKKMKKTEKAKKTETFGTTETIEFDKKTGPDNKTLARIAETLSRGGVIVYPTDTVYGIGCDARNGNAVKRVRAIKKRSAAKPFSVIAPSKAWIARNCLLTEKAVHAFAFIPGPLTLILGLKRRKCIASETNSGLETLGVRIPKHWISLVARKANAPIVTTSVNESGEAPAQTLAQIRKVVAGKAAGNNAVDLIVFEGELRGKPSRVIDLTSVDWKVKRK